MIENEIFLDSKNNNDFNPETYLKYVMKYVTYMLQSVCNIHTEV